MIKRLFTCVLLSLFFHSCYAEKLIVEPDMGKTPLLSAINHAKSSIDIVIYGFTDKEFLTALQQAQHAGKNVNVLIEKSPYKSNGQNDYAIQALKKSNINLQFANPHFKLTHQKTMVIDQHDALIMTFNFTKSAFKDQRNFALWIDDPQEITEILAVMHNDILEKNTRVSQSNLVWSPNNSREKLLDLINHAKKSIAVYAQQVTDYKTIGALAHAAKGGVNVTILTNKPNDRSLKKYEYLTHAGVNIHYTSGLYIHAKVIIVDHQTALLGSMNLTKPSIDDNRELSILTQNPETISALELTFKRDLGGTNFSAIKSPDVKKVGSYVFKSAFHWLKSHKNFP